ncbi:MAG: S8 family serine peptidase [Verrucomicrobiae bacterium]|nr:S8 family serine peptidase [Verrucomicrobiae bacterium]
MPITINNIVLDLNAPASFEAASNSTPSSAAETDYVLVQVTHSLNRTEKNELTKAGAEIQQYVPDDTYKCRFKPTNVDALLALPFVKTVLPYYQVFKVDPALTHLADRPELTAFDEMLTPEGKPRDEVQEVDVIFHENVVAEEGALQVEAATAQQIRREDWGERKVRLQVSPVAIDEIKKLDVVSKIEKVLPNDLFNNVARSILAVPVAGTLNQLSLTGEGEIVAVADTGFDNGKMDSSIHPAFLGKVKTLYALGRPNPPDASDPHGHGTHVAGSVLGDGNSVTLGVRVQGTAPGAQLVLQSCYRSAGNELGGLPSDLHHLFNPPYFSDGARLHSNSWGTRNSAGTYNANAEEIDDFVYKNRDLLVLFAAGNEGRDDASSGVIADGSVTAPGTAKNCLTVGASENARPGNPFTPNPSPVSLTWGPDARWPKPPISTDHQAHDPEGMAAFSGRGPTRNQRIKPDVVAPGTFILSAQSRRMPLTSVVMPSADSNYRFSRGTSMSTPLVAGCAALVREWLATHHATPNPSAALLKALIINGATDMAGQYTPSEAPAIPNHSEGFGRVNVADTINHDGLHTLLFFDEGIELDTQEIAPSREFSLPTGAKIKVTLVWTDPPGAGLQSDLDLIVRDSAGTECHGNMQPNDPRFDRVTNFNLH